MGQSLAAKSGAVSLPAVLDGQITMTGPEVVQTTYVSFVSQKSPAFPRLQETIKDLKEGDPVLIRPEPELPIKLNPFRFVLLAARQLWADWDDTGNFSRVSFNAVSRDDKEMKETIESVLIVVTPNNVEAARCTWKTTKCPAIFRANKELEAAQDTEKWSARSPEHKYAAERAASKVNFRFVTSVRVIAKTARSTGRTYYTTQATVTPTTEAEFLSLKKFLERPGTAQLLEDMSGAYERRVNDYEAAA